MGTIYFDYARKVLEKDSSKSQECHQMYTVAEQKLYTVRIISVMLKEYIVFFLDFLFVSSAWLQQAGFKATLVALYFSGLISG